MQCLVPIAQKPGRDWRFRRAVQSHMRAFPEANPGIAFHFRFCHELFDGAHAEKIPAARNWLLDHYLTEEHDTVLWIDDDIVTIPPDLPTRLHRVNPGGITAPLVLLEGSPGQFYDTRGFVEAGQYVSPWPPYFDLPGDFVELDSVGACYLAPASLYRSGVRYPRSRYDLAPAGQWPAFPDHATEHADICAAAQKAGLTVGCLTTVSVEHAHLPSYGEHFR